MPQPLSSVCRDAGVMHTKPGWSAFAGHDRLARLAMEAIASWASVEHFMITLYVGLAGGPNTAAAAIFLAQETNAAKNAALAVLVERKLSEPRRALYAAITELIETRGRATDRLSTWIWGRSPELPDALLLTDPRALAEMGPGGTMEPQPDLGSWVYREADFAEIVRANEELACWGFDFHLMLEASQGEDMLYRALCEAPDIREILDRRDSQARSREGDEFQS